MPKSKPELEHDLEALKLEHEMIKTSLHKGMMIVLVTIIALSATLFSGGKSSILDGNQYLALVGIIVAGILVYFSFVFSRELKLKAKVSEKIRNWKYHLEKILARDVS